MHGRFHPVFDIFRESLSAVYTTVLARSSLTPRRGGWPAGLGAGEFLSRTRWKYFPWKLYLQGIYQVKIFPMEVVFTRNISTKEQVSNSAHQRWALSREQLLCSAGTGCVTQQAAQEVHLQSAWHIAINMAHCNLQSTWHSALSQRDLHSVFQVRATLATTAGPHK